MIRLLLRAADWILITALIVICVVFLDANPLFALEVIALLVYGVTACLLIAVIGISQHWPPWVFQAVLDAALGFYFLMWAAFTWRYSPPFAFANVVAVGVQVGHVWDAWRNNRKGKFAPRLAGKIVLNLGHRLVIGNA